MDNFINLLNAITWPHAVVLIFIVLAVFVLKFQKTIFKNEESIAERKARDIQHVSRSTEVKIHHDEN